MGVNIAFNNTVRKKNRIKLLNRKLEIENEVAENEIPNEIKLKLKIIAWVLTLQSSKFEKISY